MTVCYKCGGEVIATASLSIMPKKGEVVKIYGTDYFIADFPSHEIEIKRKPSGKNSVTEKIICPVEDAL